MLAHRKQFFDEMGQVYEVQDWLDNPSPPRRAGPEPPRFA
jgi:hypothetical protein